MNVLPRAKIRGFKKYGKVRYQGRAYFIKGRMSSGYVVLMDIHGTKQDCAHTSKLAHMTRLTARRSCLVALETLNLGSSSLRDPIAPEKTSESPPPLKKRVFSAK
ncbi:MAG: hypothetical protein ACFFBD_22685 [Candidatus Hodarchaeota archaeon]